MLVSLSVEWLRASLAIPARDVGRDGALIGIGVVDALVTVLVVVADDAPEEAFAALASGGPVVVARRHVAAHQTLLALSRLRADGRTPAL